MENQKNIIVAIVLAALVIIGWQFAMNYFYPAREDALIEDRQTVGAGEQRAAAADQAREAETTVERALVGGQRLAIRTPRVTGSINLTGARIDDLTLNGYRETIAKDSPPVRLFAPSNTADQHFAQFGWVGEGVTIPTDQTVWTAQGTALTPTTPVTLRWSNGQGLDFAIRLSIDANYLIKAQQTVANRGSAPVALTPYAFIRRTSATADTDTFNIQSGPVGVFDGSVDFGLDYDDVTEAARGVVTPTGATGWLGFTDHYWMSTLIPSGDRPEGAFRSVGNGVFRADLLYPQAILNAGAARTEITSLFAGAKETDVLDNYEDAGLQHFGMSIDWGWFWFFEKPIFYLLDWIFKAVGNFGIAIICLTFIIRGLMFPVAQRQFASMAGMRAVQPKMKALQERYKDDKPKLQQEMMKLYKEEKVNPLAGCLPIFLQIPVFFALYKVLTLTIEMRHQPFALWIKDLSAPDPLTPVNLFGLIDFVPPSFLAIGVLPIIVGVTMWMQFKLQPAAMDPVQQQVFSIMPWMLMFVMAPFAAGLQLYWACSNLLTIAQQRFLYSRHPQLREQMRKEAEEKKRAREREAAKGVNDDSPKRESHDAIDDQARKLFSGPVTFLKSAPELKFLPDPDVPEIAFAGRSNVGKSSLLNALTGRKALARASVTPGRTQELNFFDVGAPPVFRLCDMPGYGYAKAPLATVKKWRFLVNDYLRGRAVLKRALLLIDARHGVKEIDREVMKMLDEAALSYRIVLTKADKIKASDLEAVMARTAEEARKRPAAHPAIIVTSAETKMGIDELRRAVIEAAES